MSLLTTDLAPDLSGASDLSDSDPSVVLVAAKADAVPMTVALKRRLKSTEYLARAREAYALADACTLDQMRDRHTAAGDRWTELAGQQDLAGDDADRRAI